MKSSELTEVLAQKRTWAELASKYCDDKERLLERNDGSATSGDFPLILDVKDETVSRHGVLSLCDALLRGEIDGGAAYFLATGLVLSGFGFDTEATEDAVHELSTPSGSEATAVELARGIVESFK